MQQRSGQALPGGQAASTWTPASWARSRWRARGGTATPTTCARRRHRSQTQPSNLDWAHFLGPLKWRDWDPQQYWNWRAYLDFGGGQVTDLFTHWIDVVHMFMGAGHSDRGVGRRRRLSTTRTAAPRRTRSTCCWNIRRSSRRRSRRRWRPGITGGAIEFCGTEGRLWIIDGRATAVSDSRRPGRPGGGAARRPCEGDRATWTAITSRTSWTA